MCATTGADSPGGSGGGAAAAAAAAAATEGAAAHDAAATESLVARAARELEALRAFPAPDGGSLGPACRRLLRELPGNGACVDCGSRGPDWASVSFGSLLCLRCSGRHRSYGVRSSTVRSVSLDSWTHTQVLCMLEGGNRQLQDFFERHRMGDMPAERYHTKAARFYRTHLLEHAQAVAGRGPYRGREESRRKAPRRTRSQQAPREEEGAPRLAPALERKLSVQSMS